MQFEDLPTRFADALEAAASRVRAMTADRMEGWLRTAMFLGIAAVIGATGLVFLLITAHRALSIGLGAAGSLATLGGLFLVAGLFIWNRGSTHPRGRE
nr:hypothetical protein [bacterium]